MPETEHYLEATKSFTRKFPHLELAYDREVDASGSLDVSFLRYITWFLLNLLNSRFLLEISIKIL